MFSLSRLPCAGLHSVGSPAARSAAHSLLSNATEGGNLGFGSAFIRRMPERGDLSVRKTWFGGKNLRRSDGRRWRTFWLVFAMAAACLALASEATAATGKRVALVIGNGDYKIAPRLDNPVDDAKAVAAAFKHLGFQVTEGYDLSIAQMRSALSAFTESLPDSEAAVVYYAGHGVSFDGENYLLPTDIALKTPGDLDLNAINVALILRQMRREERVNIVILDACRNNPFAEQLLQAKTRAVVGERGLSRIEGDLARGSLIAFASDPDSTALDGRRGEHSPFTKALLDHLEDPNVSIETVMTRVRTEVWESTKNLQLPWVNTSLIGEFDLNPKPAIAAEPPTAASQPMVAPPPEAPTAAAERQATENLLWESAQHSNLAADYQAYLDAFPSGVFAPMARNRIAVLTAPPPVSPPSAPPDATALTRSINVELRRVGCYSGAAEADWTSAGVKSAIADVVRYASLAQSPATPSAEFLTFLESRTGRLCPLVCAPNESAHDGLCVARRCNPAETMNAKGECAPTPTARARPRLVSPRKVVRAQANANRAATTGGAAPSADADPSHLCPPGLHLQLRHFRAFTCVTNE